MEEASSGSFDSTSRKSGSSKYSFIRFLFLGIGISAATSIFLFVTFDHSFTLPSPIRIAILAAAPGTFTVLFSILVRDGTWEREENFKEIKDAQERLHLNPDKPILIWEVATLKLQSYIDRNISQTRWIFGLMLVVMTYGLGLVSAGIWRTWDNPQFLGPSIVAACSGIIVQFIGASFLVVYKSTFSQAKDYVYVLERINAVGMSLQILETVDSKHSEIREKARVEVSKELLKIYAMPHDRK